MRWWPLRRSLVAAAGAMLLLSLAACAGGGSNASSGGADKVVWYTTFASDDVHPMVAAFNKKYPDIQVEALRLSADKIPQRVLTEQRGGKYNADVISGESVYVSQLVSAQALMPYNAPQEAPLPTSLDLPDGYRTVIYANTTVIAYNPAALKAHHLKPPTSWQDLTKPEWKGRFSIDPGAVNFYQSMIASMGHDDALKLIQALGANSPRLVESHTLALTQVQAGEPLATATAYGYKAAKLKRKTPDRVEFVNTKPLPTSLTLIDLAKKAPHEKAAKVFLDWMESKEGQKAVVDVTNHVSLRDDVGNDPTVWDPSKWPPAWVGPASPSQYNTLVSEYKEALHAS
ncbi:MAG TPA: extracellular solute-binding protein [Actinomycetes bacterium]|jgi:iron(III) transport system substrate-binding protein|nr:extracellular solute-binding protein [Actinomycetes bacterium]